MNWTALRVWVQLFWMMTAFGIFRSSLAQQAGPAGTALVMDGRAVPAASGDKVSLTTQVRQWLSRHDGLIPIGITVIPPQVLKVFERHEGFSIDYIRLLERRLGCDFKPVPYPIWSDAIQAAKTHRIDMIFAAGQTPERLKHFLFSDPYIEMPDVLDVVLSVLECDSAGLVHPCDPEAAAWQALIVRARPEFPGASASHDPVGFGPGNEHPLPVVYETGQEKMHIGNLYVEETKIGIQMRGRYHERIFYTNGYC